MDLGMEVILSIFSKAGLSKLFDYAVQYKSINNANSQRVFELRDEYITSIEPVIHFLQGKNQTLARQINSLNLRAKVWFLPFGKNIES